MSKNTSNKIQHILELQFNKELPFALYRLPNRKQVHLVAQSESKILSTQVEGNGFVFAPFSVGKSNPVVFIKAEIERQFNASELTKLIAAAKLPKYSALATGIANKNAFLEYVNKAIALIKSGKNLKVVCARTKQIATPRGLYLSDVFGRLCSLYPGAFVSLVYSKTTGLWMGATPEVLVRQQPGEVTTYSLAGTKFNSATKWGLKEKEEQQFVTDYIAQQLQQFSDNKLQISKPVTVKAGKLYHLRSIIQTKPDKTISWHSIATALHPTPAVAGIPLKRALSFIKESENNSRDYYSGFLGPVKGRQSAQLFVNLRCFKAFSDKILLYAGCGVTAFSNPQEEWKETELKMQTALSALHTSN